jgi:hypothetical protein
MLVSGQRIDPVAQPDAVEMDGVGGDVAHEAAARGLVIAARQLHGIAGEGKQRVEIGIARFHGRLRVQAEVDVPAIAALTGPPEVDVVISERAGGGECHGAAIRGQLDVLFEVHALGGVGDADAAAAVAGGASTDLDLDGVERTVIAAIRGQGAVLALGVRRPLVGRLRGAQRGQSQK